MSTKRIIRNAAKCQKCGDVIESKSTHDLRWCQCRALGVDGGKDYVRRLGEPADYLELTEYKVADKEKL